MSNIKISKHQNMKNQTNYLLLVTENSKQHLFENQQHRKTKYHQHLLHSTVQKKKKKKKNNRKENNHKEKHFND
jgi:hypothetical protein